MTYKSILVNIDIDGANASLIKLATDLAMRFNARLIGFSAADVPLPTVTADSVIFDGEIMVQQRENIERRLEELRQEFEEHAATSAEKEWRGDVGNPTRLLIETARAADLIVTVSPEGASSGNVHRSVDLGSLMLQAGRPVLVVARDAERVLINKALVAWKDTREARRAVADALSLLSLAKEVRVITVDDAADDHVSESLSDVSAFLSRHGIKARAEVFPEKADGRTICDLANVMHADLVVSGAYGHSRFREWAFGGVTRTLLDNSALNRFMSN
jgi:nucleotide-binding universal stress UspA family protein